MDQFDHASEIETLHREAAIQQHQNRTKKRESAYECQSCGEPIPEARRLAVPGCLMCVDCQEEYERYGKTSITAQHHHSQSAVD